MEDLTSNYYLPNYHGLEARDVPSSAFIMDDHDPCIDYSSNWHSEPSADAAAFFYNNTYFYVNNGSSGQATFSVEFFGTSIW